MVDPTDPSELDLEVVRDQPDLEAGVGHGIERRKGPAISELKRQWDELEYRCPRRHSAWRCRYAPSVRWGYARVPRLTGTTRLPRVSAVDRRSRALGALPFRLPPEDEAGCALGLGGALDDLAVVVAQAEEAGIAWADLSGNASIQAPGLRVLVIGQPNLYKRRGRPASAFARKSSRVARWLLMHPEDWASQREIAHDTGVGEGFTSKIVAKLEEDELIVRNDNGAIRARDPGLLLDAWREDYRFEKHQIIRGHIAARSGDVLLRQLGESLEAQAEPYAATGLAAAWVLTRFAAFRTASLYLEQEPNADLIEALSFREEERGANVWLVIPSDEGVFHGATTHDGIRCVHPVQAYLDLGAQPERADAAAQRLKEDLLTWRNRG